MTRFVLLFLFLLLGVCSCSNPDTLVERAYEAYLKGDFDKAFDLYRKAANLGSPDAQFELASKYLKNSKYYNPRKAFLWYSKAAMQNHVPSIEALTMFYYEGFNDDDGEPVIEADPDMVFELLRKVASIKGESTQLSDLGYKRDSICRSYSYSIFR